LSFAVLPESTRKFSGEVNLESGELPHQQFRQAGVGRPPRDLAEDIGFSEIENLVPTSIENGFHHVQVEVHDLI